MLNARRSLKAKVDGGNNAQVSSSGAGDDRDIAFGDGSSPQGNISMKTIDLSRSQAHATIEINTSNHSEHTETDGDGQV
ncbi:hypothetical protein BD410DRAFT_847308 [Rickenella mellea]|uniref:Uncharacterized protein n=1 Tax=Rickenella mellea TaxID=50990 RepID=A0A4Y7PDS0_9AGAM|nr:hypothetical protein BD410DRAFT_847308 [Rickenella mellea]